MRIRKAKNIFQSSKFCYFLCKITNILFVTIRRDASGKYYAVTTRLDVFRFICGLCVGVWNYIDNTGTTLGSSNRSIIFEIGMFLCSKYQFVLAFAVMIGTFFYRYEFFKILKNLHWIDQKVSNVK
jgi:hypothetical protein